MLPTTHLPLVTKGSRSGTYYLYKDGWTQVKPYDLILPFDFRESKFVLSQGNFVFANPGFVTDWLFTNYRTITGMAQAENAAYAKFIGKMKGLSADLGVTLGEHKSAREVILKRSKQLVGLAQALRRRDFRRANYLLSSKDFSNNPKKLPKEIASLWLEYSWGWAPMISDIGQALEVLVDPLLPYYARASHPCDDTWRAWTFKVTDPLNYQDKYDDWNYKGRVSTGATISISNPNVALANRLGLLDIPGIIWAVQPFSFIVDKYVNIGQMIGSLSDTYGFTLTNAWSAWRLELGTSGRWFASSNGNVLQDWSASSSNLFKLRKTGLLGPSLALRSPSIGSFSEAASYIALLVQLISK